MMYSFIFNGNNDIMKKFLFLGSKIKYWICDLKKITLTLIFILMLSIFYFAFFFFFSNF